MCIKEKLSTQNKYDKSVRLTENTLAERGEKITLSLIIFVAFPMHVINLYEYGLYLESIHRLPIEYTTIGLQDSKQKHFG